MELNIKLTYNRQRIHNNNKFVPQFMTQATQTSLKSVNREKTNRPGLFIIFSLYALHTNNPQRKLRLDKILFQCKHTEISRPVRGQILGSVENLTTPASMLSSVFHSRHLANTPQKTHSRFFVSVYIIRSIHKQYYTPAAPQSLLRSDAHVTRVPTYPQLYSNQKATMSAAPSQQL